MFRDTRSASWLQICCGGPQRRLVDRIGAFTIITINRREAMNALDPDTNAELFEIFDAFAADSERWFAIITGAGGRVFSAHSQVSGYRIWCWSGTALSMINSHGSCYQEQGSGRDRKKGRESEQRHLQGLNGEYRR